MDTNAANMEMKVVAIKMSARMYEIYRAMKYTQYNYMQTKNCVYKPTNGGLVLTFPGLYKKSNS